MQHDEESVNFINIDELQQKMSDEEWLDDTYETIDYKPKNKKMKLRKRVRRKIQSDPSTRRTNVFQSPIKQEKSDHASKVEGVKNKDKFSTLGEYIAYKLRSLENTQTINNVQQIITTILWQAEYGIYDDNNAVRNFFFSFPENSKNDIQFLIPEEIVYDAENYE